MNNSSTLKALVTFAILVPMAIFLGYVLSNPLSYSTFATVGIVLGIMVFPLLLKWHQPMLLFSWNMSVMVPFIKGQPPLWLLLTAVTLGIAVLERALSREMRFVSAKTIVLPLLCMAGVIVLTANLTGGFGLRAFGGEVFGGKKYVYVLGAIAAYFALTAWRIPPERAQLYVGLFFLGGLTRIIGDFYAIAPSWLQFVFWIMPPAALQSDAGIHLGTTRLTGVGTAGQLMVFYWLFRYGIRGVFLSGKPLRMALFFLFILASFLGGYRSIMLVIISVIVIQFFLEGLHRTSLASVFILAGILGTVLLIPIASKLPFTFQRALAVFPLELDPIARYDAQASSKWRLDMWEALLPQVPDHLILGKGYAITQTDFQLMAMDTSFRSIDASQQGLALAGDYHNGPLSVILPFGIWGAIVFLWLLWAGGRLLYNNYRYGDPALKLVNTFLFALFLGRTLMFLFVYGALNYEMWMLVGIFGLSVSLNNGECRKPVSLETDRQPVVPRPRLLQPRPSFQR
jgi:hypothetical protein